MNATQPTQPTTTVATETAKAPRSGPHASVGYTETHFEFEVMLPSDKDWARTTALTPDGKPFTDASDAWEWWFRLAENSDMYSDAQARLVEITRRVWGPPAEPRSGWAQYLRYVAIVEAERSKS